MPYTTLPLSTHATPILPLIFWKHAFESKDYITIKNIINDKDNNFDLKFPSYAGIMQ